MNLGTRDRAAAHWDVDQDVSAILGELHAILASRHFCHSKRYPALLRYIVENALAGKTDLLKERRLSMDVFDRPADYDIAADSVVRFTVGEVRKRLLLYYSETDRESSVKISLPVGCYVPEFHFERTASVTPAGGQGSKLDSHDDGTSSDFDPESPQNGSRSQEEKARSERKTTQVISNPFSPRGTKNLRGNRSWLAVLAIILGAAGLTAAVLEHRLAPRESAVTAFWAPVLQTPDAVVICTGSVVFDKNQFSGVATAGKESDYSFVSMQNAAAMARINGWLERSGASTRMTFSSSEPLTGLREHSVTLLGAYNNQWAMRLEQPLRFYFTQEPTESIVDRTNPQVHWERNHSLPYSSADDYGILARFRNPTTGSWVVMLAGLGRNGTEAAADFAISDRYMRLIKDRIGRDLKDRNIEAVMKVKVIDGKTGAPSILAVHVW